MTFPLPDFLLMAQLRKPVKSIIRRIFLSVQKVLKPHPKVDLSWTLKSAIQIRVNSLSDWTLYNDIFVDAEYDTPISRCISDAKSSNQPLQILDIGANVGFFALRCFDLIRRCSTPPACVVTSIEGAPTVAEELRRRLHTDNNLHGNTSIINGLVGLRSGVGYISSNSFSAMNSVLDGQGIPVNYIDLQEILAPSKNIDLLKCDIEGSELEFLRNYASLMGRVSTAVFEFHTDKYQIIDCLDLLTAYGFTHHEVLRAMPTFTVMYFHK